MTEHTHEHDVADKQITLIDGQAVRLEWPNSSSVNGVIVGREGNVHIAFGQNLEFNLQIIDNNEPTPVLNGSTISAVTPTEPTGFGAVAVDGDRKRWVRVGDGWISEDGLLGSVALPWEAIGALAVIDWGHPSA